MGECGIRILRMRPLSWNRHVPNLVLNPTRSGNTLRLCASLEGIALFKGPSPSAPSGTPIDLKICCQFPFRPDGAWNPGGGYWATCGTGQTLWPFVYRGMLGSQSLTINPFPYVPRPCSGRYAEGPQPCQCVCLVV